MRLAEDLCGCCGTGRLKLGRSLNIFSYESLAPGRETLRD